MMGIALQRFNLIVLLELVFLFACLLGKQSSVLALGLTLTLGLGDTERAQKRAKEAEEGAQKRVKLTVAEGKTALADLKQIPTKLNQQGEQLVQVHISTNRDTLLQADVVGAYCNSRAGAEKDWGPIETTVVKVEGASSHSLQGEGGDTDTAGRGQVGAGVVFPRDVVKVVSLVRHGARSICSSGECWKGYDVDGFACAGKAKMFMEAAKRSLFARTGQKTNLDFAKNTTSASASAASKTNTKDNTDRCFIGQLTQDGYEQHMNNGFRFQQAYGAFQKTDIAAWADRADRTKESAKALMSGLLTKVSSGNLPSLDAIAGIDLPWQHNPISDTLACHFCPTIAEGVREYYDSPVGKKYQAEYDSDVRAKVVQALGKETMQGKPIKLRELGVLVDCVPSHRCPTAAALDHSIPAKLETLLDNQTDPLLPHVWEKYLPAYFNTFGGPRANGHVGPLFSALRKLILTDRTNEDKRFYLISGHDMGPVGPIATALRFQNSGAEFIWPPFASYINFEFTETGYARIVYNGKAADTEACKSGPGQFYCRTADLMEALAAFVPSQEECGKPVPNTS